MRVAVVGASGHTGTFLLDALRDEKELEVVGIARRAPDTTAAPYDRARWEQVDIAAPVALAEGEDFVVDRLAEAFEGADAVVHLAWLIQPNRQRDVLRRANVDGTRRVVAACRRAGVGHLVVASSVGAYSPVEDDEPRDESWPTHGSAATSHYAVDKAAQERILDEAEAGGLAVARVRPALIFDSDSGAEVLRLFLGAFVPPPLLRPGALPVLRCPPGCGSRRSTGQISPTSTGASSSGVRPARSTPPRSRCSPGSGSPRSSTTGGSSRSPLPSCGRSSRSRGRRTPWRPTPAGWTWG